MTNRKFDPDWAVHPGELLHEALQERGMSQAQLARETGLTPKHISRIVRGRAGIGLRAARQIERAIGLSAQVMLRMQADYDLKGPGL